MPPFLKKVRIDRFLIHDVTIRYSWRAGFRLLLYIYEVENDR